MTISHSTAGYAANIPAIEEVVEKFEKALPSLKNKEIFRQTALDILRQLKTPTFKEQQAWIIHIFNNHNNNTALDPQETPNILHLLDSNEDAATLSSSEREIKNNSNSLETRYYHFTNSQLQLWKFENAVTSERTKNPLFHYLPPEIQEEILTTLIQATAPPHPPPRIFEAPSPLMIRPSPANPIPRSQQPLMLRKPRDSLEEYEEQRR